jgi:hypothetical protein
MGHRCHVESTGADGACQERALLSVRLRCARGHEYDADLCRGHRALLGVPGGVVFECVPCGDGTPLHEVTE